MDCALAEIPLGFYSAIIMGRLVDLDVAVCAPSWATAFVSHLPTSEHFRATNELFCDAFGADALWPKIVWVAVDVSTQPALRIACSKSNRKSFSVALLP